MGNVLSEARLYVCNHVVASIPSRRFRMWFYRTVMNFEIGSDSVIFLGAEFDCAGGLRIGSRSVVNQNCRLDSRGTITIGDDAVIAAGCCILTADHDLQCPSFSGRTSPVVIEDRAFVGTRAIILRGVTIGKAGVVAAGAVVTKNVLDFEIVAGIPAKRIGERTPDLEYSAAYSRLFH
jgi:acetyltransferase-like isoleucine patch superfamily enzyme